VASPLKYARISSSENRAFRVGQTVTWRARAIPAEYRREFPEIPWKHWPLLVPVSCLLRCRYSWSVVGPDGPVPWRKLGPRPDAMISHAFPVEGLYLIHITITDPMDGTIASYLVRAMVPTPPEQIGASNWRLYPHCPREFNSFPWPWDAGCKRPGAPHVLPWL
jgi:hypothetical protein